jgi:hypothetical protein
MTFNRGNRISEAYYSASKLPVELKSKVGKIGSIKEIIGTCEMDYEKALTQKALNQL